MKKQKVKIKSPFGDDDLDLSGVPGVAAVEKATRQAQKKKEKDAQAEAEALKLKQKRESVWDRCSC